MMELLEVTRGHLKIKDGDRLTTIYGEAFLRGYGSPDFLVYKNTIEKWASPHEDELIGKAKKEEIIQFIIEEFSAKKMTVEFE